MIFFQIAALFNAIGSGVICIITLANKNRSKLNNVFFLFAFSIFIWAAFYFLNLMASTKEQALILSRIFMAGAIFIPSTFLHFFVRYIGKYETHSKIVKLFYILSFIFFISDFTPFFIRDVEPRMSFSYWPIAGPLMIYHLLMFMVGNFIGIVLMFQHYRKLSGIKRKQGMYLAWGILIGFLGGLTNYFMVFDIPIEPYGNPLVVLLTTMLSFSILRYRLFDFEIFIKKGLVYTIFISIVTVVYFISIYLTEKIFQNFLGYSSIFPSLVTATLIALLFIPIKNYIQVCIDRYFFKGSYVQIAEQNEMLNKKLVQTEHYRSLATLTNGIAFQVKDPLSVIKASTHQIMKQCADSEHIKELLGLINKETDKISDLVVQLSEYSKPSVVISQDINIIKLLEEIVNVFQSDFLNNNINLLRNYNKDSAIIVKGDMEQLEKALSSIIRNAIEAMPQGGPLWIDAEKHGHMVDISIKDFGEGINREYLRDIFDPFFSTKETNQGLGLSIAQGIIENHKGKINIESELGVGTEFVIELPVT
ncbi:MAG: hypothetical protein KC733_11965 [Candidatus Omnitrophica bacterium]|nr:hypothetical protein [Candidatus Omnitrophota bacterium]